MAGHSSIDLTQENRRLDGTAQKLLGFGVVLAVAGLLVGFLTGGSDAAATKLRYHSYLVSAVFWLSIALGGLFFVMIMHLTRAGWGIAVRRVAEAVAVAVLPMAFVFIPVVFMETGFSALYDAWLHPTGHHAEIIRNKVAWLNPGGFKMRIVIYFAVWVVLSQVLFRGSIAQDSDGNPARSEKLIKWSAPGLILFALTSTFAAFDLLMSLRPEWFSTIFGVYFFAGCVLGIAAFMILFCSWLQSTGRLKNAITTEHYHDLGKLLFCFGIVFWAYIGFSQFMLIWYANIPEETLWYRHVIDNPGWQKASWFLLFGHFVVPFLAMVSRHIKRNKALLGLGGLYMLFIHWYDLFWIVMPQMKHPEGHPDAGAALDIPLAGGEIVTHLAFLVGIGGVFLASTAFALRGCSLVPERDPRIHESLAFENF
ncbi:MAG: quinol:cytochrome C oxidoreductase [Planctomycetota bacterium]